ncbi:unnamed protein product [Boreogadus saida]
MDVVRQQACRLHRGIHLQTTGTLIKPGRGLRSPAADSRKIAKVRGRLSRKIAKVRGRLSRAARPRFSARLQPGRGLCSPAVDRAADAGSRPGCRPRFSAGLQTPVLGRAADPGSRPGCSPITGSAARPSTGLQTPVQTGLHTTGLDIMLYDIQIFHVLVTPG